MENKYAILVNTCDKFEDCWEPFFKLFALYWPDYKGPIYLNTEYKTFTYGNLNIISLKICEKKKDHSEITWSECLRRALDGIEANHVLYLQEDYFLKDYVKNDIVNSFVDLMKKNEDIACIQLTDQAVVPEGPSKYEKLRNVAINQRYRISCQAALWKKDILFSYIYPHEDAWQFEEFGSKRASVAKHNFYVVDPDWVKLNQFEIIPYVFTGIVRGRWYEEVVPLFAKHNIKVDFNRRGFLADAPKRDLKIKFKTFYTRLPVMIYSYFLLFMLKMKLIKQ